MAGLRFTHHSIRRGRADSAGPRDRRCLPGDAALLRARRAPSFSVLSAWIYNSIFWRGGGGGGQEAFASPAYARQVMLIAHIYVYICACVDIYVYMINLAKFAQLRARPGGWLGSSPALRWELPALLARFPVPELGTG